MLSTNISMSASRIFFFASVYIKSAISSSYRYRGLNATLNPGEQVTVLAPGANQGNPPSWYCGASTPPTVHRHVSESITTTPAPPVHRATCVPTVRVKLPAAVTVHTPGVEASPALATGDDASVTDAPSRYGCIKNAMSTFLNIPTLHSCFS